MYTLPTNLSDDIKYFGTLIDEFIDGKLEPVKFKAIRVPMGIYEQRKDSTFMLRIRCAGGFITPHQLKRVTEIAHHHGSNLIHITTRQEIQIQNIDLKESLLILQNLKEIGLTSKGGGGNTVRNILTSVESGISKEEVFDVAPYAYNLTTKLIAEADSFTLPRKFKIAFSNSEEDTGFAKFNDLGFIATIKDGKPGFKVYLGGGIGSKPMIGYPLFDFAPVEDLFYIADAAKKLFSRYGNRKNKHKARLRFVFYRLGKEEVIRLFFEIFDALKQANDPIYIYQHTVPRLRVSVPAIKAVTITSPNFKNWVNRYATEQKQKGFYSIIVPVDNGNLTHDVLGRIADFASEFGEDTIRFSMRQNLHLRNIPQAYLANVYQLLTSEGLEIETPLILNTIVSCTGADTCRLGICLSKGASDALKKALVKSNLSLDALNKLRVHISGCPNSCGQQVIADFGFIGKVSRNDRMYPAYHVVAGASVGTTPKLAEIVGEISAFDLPKFTVDVFAKYLKKKETYASFSEYVNAEGKADIAALTEKYSNVPEFREDKNYYFDWGSDQIFSLTAKGVGECSAGLFDMIDVDLNTINQNISLVKEETDKTKRNALLYSIIFASSRMLLITRGAEPKNVTEVFNFFLTKFIDAHLVSSVFKEIVELARDEKEHDFSEKTDTIFDMALAIIALYDNMDDSLQFKNLDSDSLPESTKTLQVTTRSKDFRGVACPMNFVKTKIELSSLSAGDILEILLDGGEPIENVPGSIRGEGHTVLDEIKVDNYWKVIIKKGN